jgi:hypothetical protein
MTITHHETSDTRAPLHNAKSTGDAIANAGWFEWLARAGLVARGAIYGIIGVLALEQKKFLEKSKTGQMSEGTKKAFTALGIAGHPARMVVFALIGYFLIKAAIDFDPKKAVSVDGALAAVAKVTYGKVLLGVVAAGTIAFEAYSMAGARYRRV